MAKPSPSRLAAAAGDDGVRAGTGRGLRRGGAASVSLAGAAGRAPRRRAQWGRATERMAGQRRRDDVDLVAGVADQGAHLRLGGVAPGPHGRRLHVTRRADHLGHLATHVGPARTRRQPALQPQQSVELVGHALQRAAHRRQLGHGGVAATRHGPRRSRHPRPPPACAGGPATLRPGSGPRAWPARRSAPGPPPGAPAWPRRRARPHARAAAANAGGRSCARPGRPPPARARTTRPAMRKNSRTWATKVTGQCYAGESGFPAVPLWHAPLRPSRTRPRHRLPAPGRPTRARRRGSVASSPASR